MWRVRMYQVIALPNFMYTWKYCDNYPLLKISLLDLENLEFYH